MNHFNLLPPEIIEFIFKNVNLDDLINLSYVDKRFKQICEQFKIKQLIVSNVLVDYQSFWFYSNNPIYINKRNVIKFSKFQDYATIFQLDKHLKRLKLDIDDFNFSILNQFKLLEQLEIRTKELTDYKLSLENLKIADFEIRYYSDFKLTFDTIKLFAFRSILFTKGFVFNYPDKIQFFELIYYDWRSVYDYHIKNFNNLKYLKLRVLCSDFEVQENILSKFENLKIIDLYFEEWDSEYENITRNVKFLINEKEKSRSELEIYFNGVKLINQNKINQFKWASDEMELGYNLLEFQIKNYDLLEDNCERYEINYCDLIKLIKIIPSSFTKKFPFIHEVKANDRIDNEDQFIKFLNNLQHLSRLELINCEFTKSFYDKLINLVYLNNLEHLTIEENNDLEMNFDFILQLKQLEEFQTNKIIANHIDLIDKLFGRNGLMIFFEFKRDTKNYIQIHKWDSDPFKIKSYYLDDNLEEIDNFTIDNLEDLGDVISKLKELKFQKL